MINSEDYNMDRGLVINAYRFYTNGDVSDTRFSIDMNGQCVAQDLTLHALINFGHKFNKAIADVVEYEMAIGEAIEKIQAKDK